MKRLLSIAFMCALFATPLFASKATTVTIPEAVSVGSTQIASGEYKLSYEGAGPDVKVTLTRPRSPSVVLDAKFEAGKTNSISVTLATVDGVRVLRQIDLRSGTLVFETPHSGNQ